MPSILRALIVDDEPPARRRLRTLLRAEPTIDVIGEAEDGASAVEAIARLKPRLVFLDVQMPGQDGFDVIEQVAARGSHRCPAVIFVTAFDRYAMKAFDIHAVDYLLKPFDRARLHQAIERAAALVGDASDPERLLALVADATRGRPLRRLLIRSTGRIHFVEAGEIDWIEAMGHYISVHVGRQTHLLRDSITSLAARLDGRQFARIHRGTLVNVERIKELRPLFKGEFTVIMKDGTALHATRSYAAALTALLGS